MNTAGEIFVLNTNEENLVGGLGNDTFISTYSDGGIGGGNTFIIGDMISGGKGIDTLVINPNPSVGAGAAATSLPDNLWADVSGIERLDATTADGALTITAGHFFDSAFSAAGVVLTATTGAGAMNIDLSAFTGAAAVEALTLLAGAQTINMGSGPSVVVATAFSGSQTISGGHLTTVVAIEDGAGAQTITSTGAGAVTLTAIGSSGNQTINTGSGGDHIKVTTSAGAANTISTGNGNDTITLSAANGAGSNNTITGGRGYDLINLGLQTSGTVDTLVYAQGDSTSAGFDGVTGMTTTDLLSYTSSTTALLANGGHATGVAGLNATSSGGVVTFSGAKATQGTELASVSRMLAATNVAGTVDAFVYGGNTFVLEYNGSPSLTVVKLVGVGAEQLATAGSTVHYN